MEIGKQFKYKLPKFAYLNLDFIFVYQISIDAIPHFCKTAEKNTYNTYCQT